MEKRRTSRGFTLIELLVVIAIIAILAAILFPTFVKAKDSAKRAQCINNMGQLGKCLSTYASDYAGYIPWWVDPRDQKTTWDTVLLKYVKNKNIFCCPNNRINGSTRKPYAQGVFVRSYSMAKNVNGMIVEQVPKPSGTVVLFEKGAQEMGITADAVAEWFSQTWGYNQDKPANFYHENGKVFLFSDGHAGCYVFDKGPFAYNYSNFVAWSTTTYPNNPGGMGYCGYADTIDGSEGASNQWKHMRGANMPR